MFYYTPLINNTLNKLKKLTIFKADSLKEIIFINDDIFLKYVTE